MNEEREDLDVDFFVVVVGLFFFVCWFFFSSFLLREFISGGPARRVKERWRERERGEVKCGCEKVCGRYTLIIPTSWTCTFRAW